MRLACPEKKHMSLLSLSVVILLLHGCAATSSLSVTAGDQKNSLPLLDRNITEDVRSIAVPPFHRDQDNWQQATHDVLSSAKRISVVPAGKTDAVLKDIKKDISVLTPDERPDILVSVARSVHADAVMNGVILASEGRTELILQLLSSRDSRVLWLQAVDLTLGADRPSPDDQKEILSQMLSSLLSSVGKRERPAQPSSPQIQSQPDADTKADTQRKMDRKSKPEKKPDKRPRPAPSPDDIGPM